MYEKLKQVIIEANPEKFIMSDCKYEITLSDVLMAIRKFAPRDRHFAISPNGLFLEREVREITATPYATRMLSTGFGWDLSKNLDGQSQPTKDFLIKLLVK